MFIIKYKTNLKLEIQPEFTKPLGWSLHAVSIGYTTSAPRTPQNSRKQGAQGLGSCTPKKNKKKIRKNLIILVFQGF